MAYGRVLFFQRQVRGHDRPEMHVQRGYKDKTPCSGRFCGNPSYNKPTLFRFIRETTSLTQHMLPTSSVTVPNNKRIRHANGASYLPDETRPLRDWFRTASWPHILNLSCVWGLFCLGDRPVSYYSTITVAYLSNSVRVLYYIAGD
jgi:hypothetical protein